MPARVAVTLPLFNEGGAAADLVRWSAIGQWAMLAVAASATEDSLASGAAVPFGGVPSPSLISSQHDISNRS